MCTAISFNGGGKHLFGRTLDYECSFGEELLLVPGGFIHKKLDMTKGHLAFVGMGTVIDGAPLMYDGVNESGLAVAGLSFPYYAVYRESREGVLNIPSFLLTGLVLSRCSDIDEARTLLSSANITDTPFSDSLSPSPLHWIISDKSGSVTVEASSDGVKIYDNPFGVLTNSPDFAYHVTRLSDYMGLSAHGGENKLCPTVPLSRYSRGLGAFGLPGDFSSSSRFVRAVYLKNNSSSNSEAGEVSRLFRIMDSVSVPEGAVFTDKGEGVLTFYTVIYDLNEKKCYFSTHTNRRIRALALIDCCDGAELKRFPIYPREDIEHL